MPKDLTSIDPAWAWTPYQPDADRPWTQHLAAHLFRRVGFGATTAQLDDAVVDGPAATLDALFDPPAPDDDYDRAIAAVVGRGVQSGEANDLSASWLYRMIFSPDPLLEKLTLFWHGHFATSGAKVTSPRLMQHQNELLRRCAKGKFADMVAGISRDPAMLIYLDSVTNRKIRPNENYARELMELFCLGVGHYTEQDIKELARAFTGWELRDNRFFYNAGQHDTGVKSFLGQSGNFDGDEAAKIVLNQPAAPRFIAKKLIKFYVFDEPDPPAALLEPIAQALRDGDFEIAPVLRRIVSSNLFFSEFAIARKVRSPVDLGVGLMRTLGATTNLVKLAGGLSELGQAVFYPPNVKGWDGGRTWINSSTLLGRANLVRQLLFGGETSYPKAGGSLKAAAESAGATSPEKVVDWLVDLLLPVSPPDAAKHELGTLASEGDGPAKVVHALSAMPEFQLM